MIDKNTPKPVFSRDDHYQKKQAPQRMVYHSGSSATGAAGRNSSAKRVNYHSGAAGVYTRKAASRMDFSSSSASQGAAADRWRTGTFSAQRSAGSQRAGISGEQHSANSWRTESSESLRQSDAVKTPMKNIARSSDWDRKPQAAFAPRRPMRNQSTPLSALPSDELLIQEKGAGARQEAHTAQRAGRTRPSAPLHVEREREIEVPWFSRSGNPGWRSSVPVSTETVLEPIDSEEKTGNTVVFPKLREQEEEEPARTSRGLRSRQTEAKHQEPHKSASKKKKRKSAWKRWLQAREEKKRNAPEKTPEQLKRIRTMKKIGAVSFATLAVLICAFITSFYLFQIESINVVQPETGTAYQNEQIVQAFGTPLGNNLFGYSAQKVEADMAASLPYLESVSVKRVLPDQVTIAVTPAVETYQIESAQGGWAVLSATQKVLRLAQAQESGLITVRGTRASQPVPGMPVTFEEPDKQDMFTKIMEQVNAKELAPINEVDLTDPLEMNLLYAGRIRVILGTINDIAYKVDWAWRLVTPQMEESLKETATGILDVSTRTEEGRGKASYLAGSTEIVHDVEPPAQSQTQEITDPQAISEPSAQE